MPPKQAQRYPARPANATNGSAPPRSQHPSEPLKQQGLPIRSAVNGTGQRQGAVGNTPVKNTGNKGAAPAQQQSGRANATGSCGPGPGEGPSKYSFEKENDLLKKTDGLKVNDSLQIPKRKAYITTGREQMLDVSCFEMFLERAKSVHQYSITWRSRDSSNMSKRKKALILNALCAKFADLQKQRSHMAFDMGGIVISSVEITGGKLQDTGDGGIEHRWETVLSASGGSGASNAQQQGTTGEAGNADTVSISLKHVAELKYDNLLRYVEGSADQGALNFERKEQYLQALNIILQKYPRDNTTDPHVRSGENSWFPVRARTRGDNANALDLRMGMVAVRGFFASVRTAPSRLIVDMNSKASVFYKSGDEYSVADLIKEFRSQIPQPSDVDLQDFLKGLSITTKYMKDKDGNPRIKSKVIEGLAWPDPEEKQPPTGSGRFLAAIQRPGWARNALKPGQTWFAIDAEKTDKQGKKTGSTSNSRRSVEKHFKQVLYWTSWYGEETLL